MKNENIMNIPTIVTFIRIFLAPCIMIALYQSSWLIALLLFILAMMTDFLDGFLARYYQQESDFGKILDPLADKILIISTMWALYGISTYAFIPRWFILLLCIKDLIILCGGWFLRYRMNYQVFNPSWLAKALTTLLMAFIIYIILIIGCFCQPLYIDVCLYILSAASIIVLFDYIYKFICIIR